jgi:pyruvate ferredoxin oxidoreductase gamma subunit
MKEIRWHGRGGQGGFTAARLLGMAASLSPGYHVQAFPSFGPERRGAPVLGFTRIDTRPIHDHSRVYACDYVVVLDESLLEVVDVYEGLKADGMVLINSARGCGAFAAGGRRVHTIDATGIALAVLRQPLTSTPMFGGFVGATGLVELPAALTAVDMMLPPDSRAKNREVVEWAYNELRRKIDG